MKPRVYAQVLRNLSLKGDASDATIVKNLMQHLKASGRMKLLPGILRELKTEEAEAAALAPSVEVARKEDQKQALTAAKAAGVEVEEATVNPDLISGWRARSGSQLVDRSGKKQLIELYRNITR